VPPLDQGTVNQAGVGDRFDTRIEGLEQRQGEMLRQSGDLAGEQRKISDEEAKLIGQRSEETAQPREKLQAAVADVPESTVKEEKIPQYQRPTLSPQELHDTFAAMMVASLLVGVAARSPFSNTMTAMTGVMNGFAKKDSEMVSESLKIYDTNLKAIKERNEQKRRAVDDAWKKYSTNIGALKTQLELIAAKYDDPLALQAVRSKSLSDAQKLIDNNIRAIDNAIGRMEQTRANIANSEARAAEARSRALQAEERLQLARERAAKTDAERDARLSRGTFRDEQSLRKEYEKLAGPLKKELGQIERILQYAGNEKAFSDLQLRQAVTEFQKGARGTNAMIASMVNFGSLDQRIAGHFTRFFDGTYEPEQRADVIQLFTDLRDQVTGPALEQEGMKFRNLAVANKLNPEHVVLPDPGIANQPPAETPTVPVKITPKQ
jgi:hypothetical protein